MLDLSNASPPSAPTAGATPGVPTQRPLSLSASGTTWSAFDPTTPQAATVTVKRYNVRFTEYLTRNPAALERLSRFEGHQVVGLPKLVRAGLAAGQLMLLSEGLSGEPLDQACADHRRGVDVKVGIELIGQLARALHALHEGGLLHVDVRPAAITVDLKTHRAQFADWGHAVPVEGNETTLGSIPGIAMDGVPYASAELLAGMSPHPSDDVFALGCVAYELFSGKHPFARRSAADAIALGLAPEPLANIEPAMNDVLMQALALRREARHISMRGIAEVFNRERRTYRIPALDALLRSAWNGSFTRGAVAGIALGAVLAVSVLLLARPDEVARGKSSIAPSTVADLQTGSAGIPITGQENRSSAGALNVDVRPEAPVRSAAPAAPPAPIQAKAGITVLPNALTGQSPKLAKLPDPPRPAPREIDLRPEQRLVPLILGQPLAGSKIGAEARNDAAPSNTPISTSKSAIAASTSRQSAPASKSGVRTISASPSRSAHAQALDSCPQCSCVELREKRFSEGKSLSWEEANFVLNVCGG